MTAMSVKSALHLFEVCDKIIALIQHQLYFAVQPYRCKNRARPLAVTLQVPIANSGCVGRPKGSCGHRSSADRMGQRKIQHPVGGDIHVKKALNYLRLPN
jgi:hypothetical protein